MGRGKAAKLLLALGHVSVTPKKPIPSGGNKINTNNWHIIQLPNIKGGVRLNIQKK